MINAASPVTGKAMTREEVVQKIRDFSALLDFTHAEESEAAGLPSSSPFDVESAAMRIGYCADHAGLIAFAAEGLEAMAATSMGQNSGRRRRRWASGSQRCGMTSTILPTRGGRSASPQNSFQRGLVSAPLPPVVSHSRRPFRCVGLDRPRRLGDTQPLVGSLMPSPDIGRSSSLHWATGLSFLVPHLGRLSVGHTRSARCVVHYLPPR